MLRSSKEEWLGAQPLEPGFLGPKCPYHSLLYSNDHVAHWDSVPKICHMGTVLDPISLGSCMD